MSDTPDAGRAPSDMPEAALPPAPLPEPAPRAASTAIETASDIAGMPLGRQLPLTVWHTVAFTPRVARAMLERAPTYLSPVRVFMILIGMLLGLGAFFQLPFVMDAASAFPPGMHEAVDAHLREAGTSLVEAKAESGRWMSLIYWVIMAVAAFPFVLLFKAFRPSLSWWTHLQGYLIANNAMLTVSLAGAPLLLFSTETYVVFQIPAMIMFFVAVVRIASGAYKMRPLGVTLLIGAMIPVTLVTMVLAWIMNAVSLHAILMIAYDVSLIDLFNAGGGAEAAGDFPS